jgi:hypothetical protein
MTKELGFRVQGFRGSGFRAQGSGHGRRSAGSIDLNFNCAPKGDNYLQKAELEFSEWNQRVGGKS